MIDVRGICLLVVEAERRVLDYFERGEFDGSTVGREWNVGEGSEGNST